MKIIIIYLYVHGINLVCNNYSVKRPIWRYLHIAARERDAGAKCVRIGSFGTHLNDLDIRGTPIRKLLASLVQPLLPFLY